MKLLSSHFHVLKRCTSHCFLSSSSNRLGSAISGKVTGLTALEAVSLTGGSAVSAHFAVGAVSGQVTELTATEAVSTSAGGGTSALDLRVGAVSSEMTSLTASVAVVASGGTLALSLSTETRTTLGAVSGEMVGFTAVEAVSTLATHGSRGSLGSVGAVASHVSLSTTSEASVVTHSNQ